MLCPHGNSPAFCGWCDRDRWVETSISSTIGTNTIKIAQPTDRRAMPDNNDRGRTPYRKGGPSGPLTYHLKNGACGCGEIHGSPLDHSKSFPTSKGFLHLHRMDGTCALDTPCRETIPTPTRTEPTVARGTSSIDARLDELEAKLEQAKREKDFFENVPDEPVVDPDDPCFIFMYYESDNGRTTSWKYAVGKTRGNRTSWNVCGQDSYVLESDLSWERLVTRHFFSPDHQITISEAVGWEQLFTHPPINNPAETAE